MTDAQLVQAQLTREARTPGVLLGYQRRWVADRSQVKVAEKSRRTGFTWGTSAECVVIAASADGMDCWYVGYNKEMAEEFIRDSADWALHLEKVAVRIEEELIRDGDKDILTYSIRFASGHRITALSSRPSNLRGKQGYVVLDEAAFHDDLEELLKAALALLMWGGRVAIISTHNGVANAFNQLVQDTRAGKRPYSLHRVTLDDAIADGLFQRICLRRKMEWSEEAEIAWREELVEFYGDAADEELFCVPRQSGGIYIPGALVEARMVDAPVIRREFKDAFSQLPDEERAADVQQWLEEMVRPLLELLDPEMLHAFGEDFARSGDMTSIFPMAIDSKLCRRVPFIVELGNCPFKQQEQVLFYIADRLPRLVGGALDARGNGQYLAEVAAQRYGEHLIQQVMLSERWYLENMPPYKAAFEDASILLPKDSLILEDHRAIQVIAGVPKIPEKKTNKKGERQRHGDSAIAGCLAYAASRMDNQPIEFLSTGARLAALSGTEHELVFTDVGFGTVKGGTDLGGFNG